MGRDADEFRSLPDEDFRFSVGITRGDVANFFRPSPEADDVCAERRRWLTTEPGRYAGLLAEASGIPAEFCRLAEAGFQGSAQCVANEAGDVALRRLLDVSGRYEPDLVFLHDNGSGRFVTVGGVVCFPSSWSLPEKLGLTVEEVHDIVPGLNAALQPRIQKFLQALKPGEGWIRSNWGAAASGERNQHPDRKLPPLTSACVPDQVWLRREHQILFRLPVTGGVVFGIRIEQQPLQEIVANPALARRWARGLRTMPADMLTYKRLLEVRELLLNALE